MYIYTLRLTFVVFPLLTHCFSAGHRLTAIAHSEEQTHTPVELMHSMPSMQM